MLPDTWKWMYKSADSISQQQKTKNWIANDKSSVKGLSLYNANRNKGERQEFVKKKKKKTI